MKRKKCPKKHVDDLPVAPYYKILYQQGGDYINVWSVFKLLREMGLERQASAFMNRIADIKLKDQ